MKVPVLLPNIFDHPFTYTSKEKLKIGDYVEVPFGKKKMIGIIWDDFEEGPKKKFKIKDIIKKFTKDAEVIYFATDPDREGEAISKHLYDILDKAKILKEKETHITF